MTKIMAGILSKLVASGRLQVIHYMSARGFDEGQVTSQAKLVAQGGTKVPGG
jgi:hypothetical protein